MSEGTPEAPAPDASPQRIRSKAFVLRLLAIIALHSAITLFRLYGQDAIHNLDFWYHVALGERLAWHDPATFINGLYPAGYPFLLRLGLGAGLDVLRVGQFLSWSGSLLALIAGFFLIFALTRRANLAAAGMLLLLLNGHFHTFATTEGNDMLAAGLQALGIAALWYGVEPHGGRRAGRLLALSGLSLGAAYMARYTALILLPVAVVTVILHYRSDLRDTGKALALLLVPFLLATVVQWFPSWLIYGNPLYNHQAKNVWFGIYGASDWVKNWNNVPDDIRLTAVVTLDPARFARHWLQQIRLVFEPTLLWPRLLHILWLLALPAYLLYRRHRVATRLLVLMVAIVPLFVTALAWLQPRFLLLTLWVQAVLIAWLFSRLTNVSRHTSWRRDVLAAGLLALLAIGLQARKVSDRLAAPSLTHPREVNAFLRQAGMQDAARAATNDPYLHATDEDRRTRYAQTHVVRANPATVSDLLDSPAAATWQYLVMDYTQGFGDYVSLRGPLRQARSQVAPLQLSEQRDIFCILPCHAAAATTVDLQFANGMTLTGYHLTGSPDAGGVYLYWQTASSLSRSYKVSVRIQDAQGADIWQLDGVPQQWTYATSLWQPQQPIVDFYAWRLEDSCAACNLAIVVYDEYTLEPVMARTASGVQAGPVIALGALRAAMDGQTAAGP